MYSATIDSALIFLITLFFQIKNSKIFNISIPRKSDRIFQFESI